MPAARDLAVRTLGPCPTCGRERLLRSVLEISGLALRVVYLLDCGACPTWRLEALPPGDAPPAAPAPP